MAEAEAPPPGVTLVPGIHVLTAKPTSEQEEIVQRLVQAMAGDPLIDEHASFIDHATYVRFLRARNWDVDKARDMLQGALEWRSKRRPYWVLSDPDDVVTQTFRHENETGKIRVPGVDRWGRSVMIFDNSVQNTNDGEEQIRFLAWNMELCCRTMTPGASDKICLFMHLGKFSFFNNPPMKVTKETIHILCNAYPERLGTCILYQAPSVFYAAYNAVKFLIDEKTQAKIVFVSGDVSDGSRNDVLLKYLIADDWKKRTGTEQPPLERRPSAYHGCEIDCSGGFSMDEYWPTVLAREQAWASRHLGRREGETGRTFAEACAQVPSPWLEEEDIFHPKHQPMSNGKHSAQTPQRSLPKRAATILAEFGRSDVEALLCVVVLVLLNTLAGIGVLRTA